MANPGKTDIKQLMDLDEIYDNIFDSKNRGKGLHSMDSMPPDTNNQSFKQKMINENMERQKQMKPLSGKLRTNVNMSQAMNGGMELNGMEDLHPMQSIDMHQLQGPIGGSLMNGGMSGQHINRNSGSIYPSDPRMNYPPEKTSFSENDTMDAQNYQYGPRAYSLDKNFRHNHSYNDYETMEKFSDQYNSNNSNNSNMNKRLNCLDVANHVKFCPICSKFYDNDKTMYVVAIIILVIICIILMKKVLENYEK